METMSNEAVPSYQEHPVFFQRIWNRIKGVFRSGSNTDVTKHDTNAIGQENIDQYDELSELTKPLESYHPHLSNELRQFTVKSIPSLWRFGRIDGAIGQKQMHKDFFKTYAEQIRDEVAGYLESQKVKYTVEYKIQDKVLEDKVRIKDEAERYRNEIFTRKELYPRSYSRWLAYFYVVLALLLIIADVPLALKLTQYGFNLHTDFGAHSIDNFFIIQPECSQEENILGHTWLVFANNWEVFVLAFGIALCTIYIKIFYDDFVGYPVDKAVRQFEILNRFGKFTENDKKAIRWKFRARIFLKVVILLLTLGTIIYLGLFRAETSAIMDKALVASSVSEVEVPIELEGTFNETPPSAEVQSGNTLGHLTKVSFILITILFPVVGGICLSLGIGNFQNRREIEESSQYFEERNKEYLKALGEFTEVAQNKEICENNLKRVTKDDFVVEFTNFFYYCYQHGYERGVVEPDKSLDIYDRVQRLRDRLISTKSFDAIQQSILSKTN